MIYLSDLSPLMQRTIAKNITFMISQSGLPNNYNLYFAKHTGRENHSIHLSYDLNEGQIFQYADENHSFIEFNSIDEVLNYVDKELNK